MNSAVTSDGLSACRWHTFWRAFVFQGGPGDFLFPYFLVIPRLRPMAALGLNPPFIFAPHLFALIRIAHFSDEPQRTRRLNPMSYGTRMDEKKAEERVAEE
jgi:hypothetical protein